MIRKSLLAFSLLATFGGQSDASAQTTGIAEGAKPDRATGVQTAIGPSGFELTTHGVWAPLAPAAYAGEDIAIPARVGPSPALKRKLAPVAHSFRRAIYLPHVSAAEAEFKLPAGLLDALIWTESRYNPFAVSGAGAAGLGQLMPRTARDLGVSNRFNPRESVWASARYLRQLLDKFGMLELAVAAYNAGPSAVERARGIPLNGETPVYVRNVLEMWGSR